MNEQNTPEAGTVEEATTLTERANDIRDRNAAISELPPLSRVSESVKLADALVELVADMAAVIDHNTPYLDETHGH